jgi:hypothetical protein
MKRRDEITVFGSSGTIASNPIWVPRVLQATNKNFVNGVVRTSQSMESDSMHWRF